MAKNTWTNEQIQFLKDNYQVMTFKEIGETLGKSTGCVGSRALKLGLKKGIGEKWTTEEEEILKAYYPAEGLNVFGRLPNRTCFAIVFELRKLKLDKTPKVPWTDAQDEIACKFYLENKSDWRTREKFPALVKMLEGAGPKHSLWSVMYKEFNFAYEETGRGLSHIGPRARKTYKNVKQGKRK